MIQPTDNSRSPIQFNQANAHAAKPKVKPEAVRKLEHLDTGTLQRLRDVAAREPAIRPGVVELGRKLSADPGYPPEHVVEKLAGLLSRGFEEEGA